MDVKPARSSLEDLSLEQLLDCGRYGRSAVAENERGELVSIYDVPRGLACNCVCPSCRRVMVARTKDDIRVAHFAHHGNSDDSCTTAGETALHMFAKQLADERLVILLPELVEEVDFERELVSPVRRVRFDEAALEARTGQIVPDVVLTAGGRRLIVEFKVTHGCGPEKIARIRDMNIAAIEIDLSSYRGTRLRNLGDAILFQAPRTWLHNPRSAAARSRAQARAHLRRAAVANEVEALAGFYQHILPSIDPGSGECESYARREGLGDFINLEVSGAGCFLVPTAEWQAGALLLVLKHPGGIQPAGILTRFVERGWVARWTLDVSQDVAAGLRGSLPNFLPPEEAIAVFLDQLSFQEVITRKPDGSYEEGWHLRNIRQRPAERFDQAMRIVKGILELLPAEEAQDFDFERWVDTPVGELRISLRQVVKADGGAWPLFIRQLRLLWPDVEHRPETTLDLMGLPLGGEQQRSMQRKGQSGAR